MDIDTNKLKLIGMAGRKQSGKTTAARVIFEERDVWPDYDWFSFADPVKSMANCLLHNFGVSLKKVAEHCEDKEKPILEIGLTMRELLQKLGTEFGRNMLGENIWINIMKREMDGSEFVVIDDVRFENEAAFIRENGGMVIHIHRNGLPFDGHVSESGIVRHDDDLDFINHYSTEAEYKKAFGLFFEQLLSGTCNRQVSS